jgi:hypothetical protein
MRHRLTEWSTLQGQACMDPETVLHPHKFKLDRPANAYIHYGYGAHECIGREITLAFVVTLVKLCAGLKNLRPAPGDMGVLKQITLGTERCYLNDSWSHLTFDPTSKDPLKQYIWLFDTHHLTCSMETPLRRARQGCLQATQNACYCRSGFECPIQLPHPATKGLLAGRGQDNKRWRYCAHSQG